MTSPNANILSTPSSPGYRSIGLVTGSESVHTGHEREAGHVEVMLAAGLKPIVERDDISVAGFGDVAGWEYGNPALTTVHVALAAIGAAGARRALVQLSGADGPPHVRIHPVRLVFRESTRPLTGAVAAAS